MKTYAKTIEDLRLKISYDTDAESPRRWDNLGYFYTLEGSHRSPDGNSSDIYQIMVETSGEAMDTAEHEKLIKSRINKETDEKVLAIYPVIRYEHGNVSYTLGIGKGFDVSNCGFYIVTDKTQKLLGTPKKSFEKVIADELKTYSQWCNGEVYGFTLYDEDGNLDNSSWGYYDIEDIRSVLPHEWDNENLADYFINK